MAKGRKAKYSKHFQINQQKSANSKETNYGNYIPKTKQKSINRPFEWPLKISIESYIRLFDVISPYLQQINQGSTGHGWFCLQTLVFTDQKQPCFCHEAIVCPTFLLCSVPLQIGGRSENGVEFPWNETSLWEATWKRRCFFMLLFFSKGVQSVTCQYVYIYIFNS